ncbi:phage prohead protease, HK97 family [Acetobacteraceae bacterium AT-5844]|nr:phage prohead protease, HK97 family [Acetobacteraceae bacterium AT-5844]
MDPDTETPASLELRFVEVDVRASANADGETVRRIEGLAAPYQAKTRIRAWGGHEFEEALEPGVFGETLRSGADVRLLLEHDSRALLARTKAGNLRLRDTPRGLEFEADLPDTQLARDVLENIRAKNYPGMSFGFVPKEMARAYEPNGRLRSVIHRAATLREISVVALPAYAKTSVAMRSILTAAPPADPAEALALRARLARLRA